MKYIYWSICAFDINENKRSTFSPQLSSEKDAKLWKMKYIVEHPDDYIMFNLMKDNGLVEKLRKLLRRYFETDVNGDPIPEHDPNYTAQDFVDDVHFLVGRI